MKPEDLVKGTRLIKKGVRPEHQRRYTVELTAKEHWGHLMLYLRNESTQQLKHVKVQNVLENFWLADDTKEDDAYVQKLKEQLERACLDRDAEHRLRLEAEANLLRLQREFDSFKLSAEYRMIA